MSLTLVRKESLKDSHKFYSLFKNEHDESIECNSTPFRTRTSPQGDKIRLVYELWTHPKGKTCKIITSKVGIKGSRKIFKGKVACRTILDKFKALPYAYSQKQ